MMKPLLQVVEITKVLGNRDILRRLSFSCGPSDVALILGDNGVGKSTLLRILSGVIEPDQGQILICGELLNDGGLKARQALGYMPDTTDALPDLTVAEFIALIAALKGMDVGHLGGKRDDMADLRGRLGLEVVWRQRLSTLSFGQRKRTCLLAALVGQPWLLVLDEPSNGLDREGTVVVREIIEARRAEGKATVLTTNDPAFAHSIAGSRYELRDAGLHSVSSF